MRETNGNGKRSSKQKSELGSLANVLLPMIRVIYESEEGQQAFADWQAEIKTKSSVPNT
jgi:hypothetical protein